jgi:hypothetical protein
MNFDDVSVMYFAKNLLNEYRQLRGYNDPNGNYPKVINEVEDNVRFLAIVRELGHDAKNLKARAFSLMDIWNKSTIKSDLYSHDLVLMANADRHVLDRIPAYKLSL